MPYGILKSAMVNKWVILCGFFMLVINACTNDQLGLISSSGNESTGGVCFQSDVLPIVVNNCANAGCHNPKDREEGLDYTTYAGIKKSVKSGNPSKSELIKVIRSGEMPPRGYPEISQTDLSTLTTWIVEGGLNTQDCSALDCTSAANVSYSQTIVPIIKKQCIGCHTARLSEAGYSYDIYAEVLRSVNNNSFLGSIKHQASFVPMPYNAGKISSCEITFIETWIAEGKKNN